MIDPSFLYQMGDPYPIYNRQGWRRGCADAEKLAPVVCKESESTDKAYFQEHREAVRKLGEEAFLTFKDIWPHYAHVPEKAKIKMYVDGFIDGWFAGRITYING